MTAPLQTSILKTSTDMSDATSLPELPDGNLPSRCPATLDLFGQEAAPASPSQPPAKDKHQAMNATSGPSGSNLSALADRQQSLANRLKRQLDGVGSTLFTLTWNRKATPLGRPYYQLQALGRRISGNDCGSWPTPNAGPQNDNDTTWQERRKELKEKHGNGNGFGMVLGQAAQLAIPGGIAHAASWPTPATADTGVSETARQGGENLSVIASWATPTSRDHKDGASTLENTPVNALLGRQVLLSGSHAQTESKGQLASWPTPNAMEGGQTSRGVDRKDEKLMGGLPQGKGQLNPSFSLWLMGYPPEWVNSAPPATRLSRKSRQNSSRQRIEDRG
jgi:hypothetical protein